MGDFRVLAAAAIAACALSGCGLATNMVGATSQAALAPAANIAQNVSYGLQAVDRTVTTMATTARATAASVASSTQTASVAATQFQSAPATAPMSAYQPASLT